MNLRPRAKTEAMVPKKPRISIFTHQQSSEPRSHQKGQITAHNTNTTTRANIFDLKSPEERSKSASHRKKKYIHVVSGKNNQQTDQKNINVDILGSLKKYLQKNGNMMSKNITGTYSANPTDTPIKKLSIFQELEIENENYITTMRQEIRIDDSFKQRSAHPQRKYGVNEPSNNNLTTRQKIHIFSNDKLKTQPRACGGNENSIGKLRHLIKIVGRNH